MDLSTGITVLDLGRTRAREHGIVERDSVGMVKSTEGGVVTIECKRVITALDSVMNVVR